MVSLGELGFDITAEKAPTLRSGFSIKLNEDKEVITRMKFFEERDDDSNDFDEMTRLNYVSLPGRRLSSVTCNLRMSQLCASMQRGNGQ